MGGQDSPRQLLYAFFQEFFGSLLLYLLFFPTGAILGNSLEGWVFHFLAVIVFDILTDGACANPAICVALFLSGKQPFIVMVVRIAAELLVGTVGFPITYALIPTYLKELSGGPELSAGVDIYHGAVTEGFITFLFALSVLLASTFIVDVQICRPLYAAILRILIEFGGPTTGANMNTMIGFSWAWYTKRAYSQEYHAVYSVAPLIGSVIAAGAYHMLVYIIPTETKVIDVPSKKQSRKVENDKAKQKPKKKAEKEVKEIAASAAKGKPASQGLRKKKQKTK